MYRICLFIIALLLAFSAVPAYSQTFDTSGTGNLHGQYAFRYVLFFNDPSGNILESCSVTGLITFNGSGQYSTSSRQVFNSAAAFNDMCATSAGGTYAVQSNGMAQLDNPIYPATLYGSFNEPVLMASSTENSQFDFDLFVALKTDNKAVSNSLLEGAFSVGVLDVNSLLTSELGGPGTSNGFFTLQADGNGNIAPFTITGVSTNSPAQVMQDVGASTYSLSGPALGIITFPPLSDSTRIISGAKALSVSADGNYILAGSTAGADILFGFRAPSGGASNTQLSGTYFTAGLDATFYVAEPGGFYNILNGFQGSINTNGNGVLVWHKRTGDSVDLTVYDDTFSTTVTLAASGSYFDGAYTYLLAADGGSLMRIGSGSEFSLDIGVRAASLSPGSSVWIDPVGITNAANYAPITNSFAPGEVVNIFGSFSVSSAVDSEVPLATKVNGVAVFVNGRNAPVYSVGASQITALIPYELAGDSYATFQVVVNGSTSNSVTVYLRGSAPGIYTFAHDGIGPAASLHQDYSAVTDSSPARPGETVLLFLAGLGSVTRSVGDGAPGPSNPLSYSLEFSEGAIGVYFDDGVDAPVAGKVAFAGLAPCCIGLYQANVTLPTSGLANGKAFISFETLEAKTRMSTISVAGF